MKYLKTTIFTAITVFGISLLTSCGGSGTKETAKVKPEKTSISGDLSDYIQVVDNQYEVVDDWGGQLSIKVKAIKSMPSETIDENDFELSASLLGDNGMPVSGTGEFEIEYNSEDKLKSLLKSGSGEEVISLKALLGDYKADEHASKVKLFTVSSTVKKKEEPTSTTSSSNSSAETTTSNTTASSGSEDWDQMLDDYEEYVDEYIKFYKKAMNGDQSAMSEYPTLMEKATKLQTSMEKAQSNNELTASQITRMTKIQTKMMNAVMEIQ